jgi:hypothetical protein
MVKISIRPVMGKSYPLSGAIKYRNPQRRAFYHCCRRGYVSRAEAPYGPKTTPGRNRISRAYREEPLRFTQFTVFS